MARKTIQQLAYTALRIEGGLIPAEELTRLTTLAAPEATEQTEGHYDIPRGLKLRDEIARYFKIAQNLWQDFSQQRQRQDANSHSVTSPWVLRQSSVKSSMACWMAAMPNTWCSSCGGSVTAWAPYLRASLTWAMFLKLAATILLGLWST